MDSESSGPKISSYSNTCKTEKGLMATIVGTLAG